jgi:hypothetical protein
MDSAADDTVGLLSETHSINSAASPFRNLDVRTRTRSGGGSFEV